MYLFDVNIWVNAHREDSPDHKKIYTFVSAILENDEPFAYSPLCLSGFLRIVTHPKIFLKPTSLDIAMEYAQLVTEHPNAVAVQPDSSHWHIFTHLCVTAKPGGNLIPDTWFAALAVSSGCTWVTSDRDYMRFSGLSYKIL